MRCTFCGSALRISEAAYELECEACGSTFTVETQATVRARAAKIPPLPPGYDWVDEL